MISFWQWYFTPKEQYQILSYYCIVIKNIFIYIYRDKAFKGVHPRSQHSISTPGHIAKTRIF
jgi:hypothetical protein